MRTLVRLVGRPWRRAASDRRGKTRWGYCRQPVPRRARLYAQVHVHSGELRTGGRSPRGGNHLSVFAPKKFAALRPPPPPPPLVSPNLLTSRTGPLCEERPPCFWRADERFRPGAGMSRRSFRRRGSARAPTAPRRSLCHELDRRLAACPTPASVTEERHSHLGTHVRGRLATSIFPLG